MADLGVTAESAMTTAAISSPSAKPHALVAGSVEEASPMIERCLGPTCSGILQNGVRSEGASVLVFESEERVRARGGRAIARVAWWTSWRGEPEAPLADAPPPRRRRHCHRGARRRRARALARAVLPCRGTGLRFPCHSSGGLDSSACDGGKN